jgi:glycosyltransferase involved in cell wall biosynthesis
MLSPVSLLLSVVLITLNEEQNLGRTLESVRPLVADGQGEIIVVDSGSTDRTVEIAKSYGAKVFVEEWKGFAAQKNSAIEKAEGEWVLSLDADESLEPDLTEDIRSVVAGHAPFAHSTVVAFELTGSLPTGYWMPRKNLFLGRWIRHGGFWPDPKLRLFLKGKGSVENRAVHETVKVVGGTPILKHALLHHAYPTLEIYLEHMRRYADLGAEMIKDKPSWWLWLNRWFNPPLTFFYNYVVRLGFLDGREGFLLHWNHRRYVGWKYAKALELSSSPRSRGDAEED